VYIYILEPKAQQEYENSIEWYSERSETATLNFIDTIESTIAIICSNPNLYKKRYKIFMQP
jgi:plasmid stabilization system protein ParE